MRSIRLAGITLILLLLVAGAQALTVKNRSYSETANGVQANIGDELTGTSANNFKPILKLARGDTWLSVLPTLSETGTATITVNQTAGKVSFSRGNIVISFYNVSGPGYEFEIDWKQKPASNVITFTILSNNLNLVYQPALNQSNKSCMSETDCGEEHRLPEAVGSYAAFYKNPPPNGPEKAFHLLRPKIYDSGKNWTWGDLNITGTTLTVTVPQKFLDSAVYPVRQAAGLKFGYTTCGGTYIITNDLIMGSKNSTAAAGNILSITGCGYWDAGYKMQYALYDASLAKVVNTSSQSMPSTGPQTWVTWNTSSEAAITAQDYWLVLWHTDAGAYFYYDAGASNQGLSKAATYGGSGNWPATISSPTYADRQFSIYAEYKAAAGGGTSYDATFYCTAAGVRNQSRTCTNVSSGALIPSKTDFYGWGTNPCIGTNTTNPNPVIFPKNASWCGLCLIALDGAGANANTSCKSQATFTTWPLWGGP